LLYAIQVLRKKRRDRGSSFVELVRDDATMCWIAFMVVYTTCVSCFGEYDENARFKFLIEQPFWLFVMILLLRCGNVRALALRDRVEEWVSQVRSQGLAGGWLADREDA